MTPVPGIAPDVLSRVGGTSMVALRRVPIPNRCRVLLKLESENPTGSMKDRMALAMIEAAEKDGRLAPGGLVVEYTGAIRLAERLPPDSTIVTILCDTGMKYLSKMH